jgi:hypothetical protein
MAVPLPSKLTYSELYGDATTNPFDMETKADYGAVFHSSRVKTRPPTVDRVLEDVLADFSRPICGIGVFVEDDESKTGHLEVARGIQPYHGIPGRHTQDRKIPFGFEGDATGVNIATVAMDKTQWEMTAAVNISGTTTRTLHFLAAESDEDVIGPHKAFDANTRTIKTRGGVIPPSSSCPSSLGRT